MGAAPCRGLGAESFAGVAARTLANSFGWGGKRALGKDETKQYPVRKVSFRRGAFMAHDTRLEADRRGHGDDER